RTPLPALRTVPPPILRGTVVVWIRIGEVCVTVEIAAVVVAVALRVLHAVLHLMLAEEVRSVVSHVGLQGLAVRLVRLDVREIASRSDALGANPLPPVDESRLRSAGHLG